MNDQTVGAREHTWLWFAGLEITFKDFS